MTFAPNRILVPVEVQDDPQHLLAEAGVEAAAEFAKKVGASLLIATFAEVLPWKAGIDFDDTLGGTLNEAEAALEADLRGRLEHLANKAKAAGVEASTEMVLKGNQIPERIVKLAIDTEADLIMMPSHGRQGVKRLVLGSVAERVVRLSPTAVLLLKPDG